MIISGPEMLMGYTTECLPGETQGAAVFSVTVRKPLHLVFPAASDSPAIPPCRDTEFLIFGPVLDYTLQSRGANRLMRQILEMSSF